MTYSGKLLRTVFALSIPLIICITAEAQPSNSIGKEVSVPVHLTDGQELQMEVTDLISFGAQLFKARWTTQEGQGRPMMKGTGNPVPLRNSFLSPFRHGPMLPNPYE
jgi:hypothetical protein